MTEKREIQSLSFTDLVRRLAIFSLADLWYRKSRIQTYMFVWLLFVRSSASGFLSTQWQKYGSDQRRLQVLSFSVWIHFLWPVWDKLVGFLYFYIVCILSVLGRVAHWFSGAKYSSYYDSNNYHKQLRELTGLWCFASFSFFPSFKLAWTSASFHAGETRPVSQFWLKLLILGRKLFLIGLECLRNVCEDAISSGRDFFFLKTNFYLLHCEFCQLAFCWVSWTLVCQNCSRLGSDFVYSFPGDIHLVLCLICSANRSAAALTVKQPVFVVNIVLTLSILSPVEVIVIFQFLLYFSPNSVRQSFHPRFL